MSLTETHLDSMSHGPNANDKVMVGMSGGVDSSVTAALLKEQGFNVEALFMKNWDDDDGSEYCTAQQDLEDALRICDQLDIELHTANFAKNYWDSVFQHFLDEYSAGRTPNPDVLCNREIKFKVFVEYANKLDARWIATGHYARTKTQADGQSVALLKGADYNKDQSYFLNAVPEAQLKHALFPLGNLEKPAVRAHAEKIGLHVSDKKDSTGICFIGERRFNDFLNRYLPAQPGRICSLDGSEIGQHNGLMFHTIGQRQGLGIGGVKGSNSEPWYVVEKRLEDNTLVVAQGTSNAALFRQSLVASEIHWINGAPAYPLHCHAKTRYRQPDQSCQVSLNENDTERLYVQFDAPQRAITPGQYIVFYDGDICLGGAVIN